MVYPYRTTQITHNRRFPTFQLHATSKNSTLPAETVMDICILETMRWLRSRLGNYRELPPETALPEPEDYPQLDRSKLRSFQLSIGCTIDVVYSEKDRLWAFCLEESDPGANPGTPQERKPVTGRKFETNIAFRINSDNLVEAGFQTICSEPDDVQTPVEVFRPSVVKALIRNQNVGLRQALNITEVPLYADSAKVIERIRSALDSPLLELPVIIVTQPQGGDEPENPLMPEIDILTGALYRTSFPSAEKRERTVTLNHEALGIKYFPLKEQETGAPKPQPAAVVSPVAKKPAPPAMVDAEKLAHTLAAFAFVCTMPEEMFSAASALLGEAAPGDIIVLYRNGEREVLRYSEYSHKQEELNRLLTVSMTCYPMRRSISFGNVCFTADARLLEYQNRRMEKLSLDEENALLRAETAELSRKLKNAEESLHDSSAALEKIRDQSKRISELETELETSRSRCETMYAEAAKQKSLVQKCISAVGFYREKACAAANFPTDRDHICKWAAETFSGTLKIHKNAAFSLKKYERPLNCAALCDGLYYLHGYALFRQGKISLETLSLYGEEYNWEVQGCGKSAMKMFPSDYSVPVIQNGQTISRTLDLHIKYGVDPQHWIRIYFFYDEAEERVVVGYMPDHLRTVSDKT